MNRTDRLYALVEELRAAAPGARSAPMPFGGAARTALHKVVAAMSAAGRSGAADLLARIHLLHARAELSAGPVLRVVEQALLEGRVLRLDYRDKHGHPTVARRVEPLGFVGAERDWYLGGGRLRGAVRVFRLDRISMVEVTGERPSVREPSTLEDGCLPERSWPPAIVA